MIKYYETDTDIKIAEITGERFMISQVQEILDLMADIALLKLRNLPND